MRLSLIASIVFIALSMVSSVRAAPFIPKMNTPESYKDITFGLSEMRQNIETVSCGGWDEDSGASVSGTNVEGNVPMPDISPDIPGRRNVNPLGDPTGGLGERGNFEFPDSAWGYSSACDVHQNSYVDADLARLGLDLNIKEDGSVSLDGGSGKVDINPHGWCIRTDKATPTLCKRLYDAWQQAAAIIPHEDVNAPCPCPEPNDGCPPRPEKRYCFDTPYTFECHGTSDKRTPITTVWPDAPPQDPTCRTTWDPDFYNKMTECHVEPYDVLDEEGNVIETRNRIITDRDGEHRALASSYYRHYAAAFMDPRITVRAPGADNTWQVRAECYEYYKEENDDGSDFDPRSDITTSDDEQCEFVIATGGEQTPRNPEWAEGDGHSQKESVKASLDAVAEPARDARPSPDPWVGDTDTNLFMIDIEKLMERQSKFDDPADITAILGTLLTTRQTGSKTIPKNGRTDQFDDTDDRTIAAFFEEQQRELLIMTADPQTRLIMPARFLVGLADDDPLFQYVRHTVSRSDGTVEITLKAGLEDIGNVIKSFQRIFIAPIQEVRIPVLVPLASVSEINARIADWKLWKQGMEAAAQDHIKRAEAETDPAKKAELQAQAAELTSIAPEADPLITKLEQYRTRLEDVRIMRGALLTHLVKLYDSEEQIRAYFADWYEQNSVLLVESSVRAVQRRELKRIWRLLQRSMLQIDSCQLLWCSNHRFSAPVYSLLDNWWGEGQAGEKRDRNYIPQSLADLNYDQPDDQLFDFSDVKFPREPWLIPTLWPVQARIRLPLPPAIGVRPSPVSEFPDLPMLPDETIFHAFPTPTVDLPAKSFITLPSTSDLEPAKDLLRKFRKIIDGTDFPEQINEENALADGESIDSGDDNFPLDRESMRGAYCRFPPSILIPPDSQDARYQTDLGAMDHSDPDDVHGNPAKIIHIENELRERLARLFSRWMPERQEDFAGRVARRNEDFPDPSNQPKCHEDIVCYFLPPEESTTTTWQWFMPDITGGNFTDLGDALRIQSLPGNDNIDKNPYFNASLDTLKRIFPSLSLPIRIQLEVPPPDGL